MNCVALADIELSKKCTEKKIVSLNVDQSFNRIKRTLKIEEGGQDMRYYLHFNEI